MSIYIGNKELKQVYIGSTPVKEIYKGSTLVWSSMPRVTIQVTQIGEPFDSHLAYYSIYDENGNEYSEAGIYLVPEGTILTVYAGADGEASISVDGISEGTWETVYTINADTTIKIRLAYPNNESSEDPELPEEYRFNVIMNNPNTAIDNIYSIDYTVSWEGGYYNGSVSPLTFDEEMETLLVNQVCDNPPTEAYATLTYVYDAEGHKTSEDLIGTIQNNDDGTYDIQF